jgi:hypothetical protein
VNTLLAADLLDAVNPKALVYAPGPNGQLRLVALEFIVFQPPGTQRTRRRPRRSGRPSR